MNEAFCIDAEDLVPAAIAILRKKHPGALPIASEWKAEGERTALIIWWCPSPTPKAEQLNGGAA
jgi:hypothetical protein